MLPARVYGTAPLPPSKFIPFPPSYSSRRAPFLPTDTSDPLLFTVTRQTCKNRLFRFSKGLWKASRNISGARLLFLTIHFSPPSARFHFRSKGASMVCISCSSPQLMNQLQRRTRKSKENVIFVPDKMVTTSAGDTSVTSRGSWSSVAVLSRSGGRGRR